MTKQEQTEILTALELLKVPGHFGNGYIGIPQALDGGINLGLAKAAAYISELATEPDLPELTTEEGL